MWLGRVAVWAVRSVMYWFRARLRWSSCIALFALALQLVLTFGHVHLDGLGGHSSTRMEASADTATPVDNEVPGDADDYCVLCALVYLAGTLVPAVAAALPLPVVFGQWRPPSLALRFASPSLPLYPSLPAHLRSPELSGSAQFLRTEPMRQAEAGEDRFQMKTSGVEDVQS